MSPFARWLLYPLIAMVLGFIMDMLIGDIAGLPHPLALIGKLISTLEEAFCKFFPKTPACERIAGGMLFFIVVLICAGVPFGLLWLCYKLTPVLGVIVETIMCWRILTTQSMRNSGLRVYRALKREKMVNARASLSHIIGQNTDALDESGVISATVESIAYNTCNAGVAPIIHMAIGGVPLAFLYNAVNTMSHILGHVHESPKNFGLIPAKADNIINFIPARISALLILLSGFIHSFKVSRGWKIFKRDRYNQPGPNAGQTQAVCAGLLGVQLYGSANCGGIGHDRKTIGDALRPLEPDDISHSCRLLCDAAILSAIIFFGLRLIVFILNLSK